MDALSKNKIKWIRSLRLKKNRDSEHLFIVEGTKMVQEILSNSAIEIACIVTTDSEVEFKSETYHTDPATMKSISGLTTPSNMLAVVRKPKFESTNANWSIVLDGVQDPGNLGTIIRTADWFGINEIVCSMDTVDCFNPKVVQSTMGSIFRVNVRYENLEVYLSKDKRAVFGALMEGAQIDSVNIDKKGILVMGNEGKGISIPLLKFITNPIHIPGKGGAESLNVAVATGILLSKISS